MRQTQTPNGSGMLVALGILGAVAAAGYLFLRDSPKEKREWKSAAQLDAEIAEAFKRR